MLSIIINRYHLSTRGVPAILFSAVEDAKAVTVFVCARMDYG